MKIQNLTTGESINVSNTVCKDGVITGRYQFGTRYFNKYTMLKKIGDTEDGTQPVLQLSEGWEVVNEKQPRKQAKEQPQPAPQAEVKDEPQPEVVKVQPQQEQGTDLASIRADLMSKYGSLGADLARYLDKVAEQAQPKQQGQQDVQHIIKVNELPEVKLPKGQEPHPLLDMLIKRVINDRALGRFPWLWGPAGSGKSTLAAQVADALGLPFYSVSSLQQKYELEGYSDAVGEFIQTAFYKAMKEGGVFCFDEASTTSPEVQVAFNTAAAQLVYNFPKIGMVRAHKDFHIIACDNTTGRGGDSRYNSRYQLDESTLDRYKFIEVGYTDEHDLRMASGDKELVKFMRKLRTVLENSNTTYLATPRASKDIKGEQALGSDDTDALWYGLCSGWNKQDVRTFASQLTGTGRYFDAFHQVVTRYC